MFEANLGYMSPCPSPKMFFQKIALGFLREQASQCVPEDVPIFTAWKERVLSQTQVPSNGKEIRGAMNQLLDTDKLHTTHN